MVPMVNKLLVLGLVVLATVRLGAQIPIREADSLSKHYQQKMNRFIDRDTLLGDYYSIDLFGVSIFPGKKEKVAGLPEFRVTWQELPVYKNIMASLPRAEALALMKSKANKPFPADIQRLYGFSPAANQAVPTNDKPLNGYRFVIDPGHFAFDSLSSRLEDKYIDLYLHSGKDSSRVLFYESQLTWQTALILKMKLENAGAIVFLTRRSDFCTSLGKTFEEWKSQDYPRALDSMLALYPYDPNLKMLKSGKLKDNKSIFKFVFRDIELRKRAALINAFHPDLTIIIHYNVDELNDPWKKTSSRNFCMAFTGGAFKAGELADPEKRFDFLRLLLTDDLEQSIYASGLATAAFKSELDVPLAKSSDATYLRDNCLPAGPPGVFCRNLSMTRLVQGPLIYGETLFQDNAGECQRLAKESHDPVWRKSYFTIAEVEDFRVSEVADAYFTAVLNWVKTK
jgi:hypothetical protein